MQHSRDQSPSDSLHASLFETEIGWILLAGHAGKVCSVSLGYDSPAEAWQHLRQRGLISCDQSANEECSVDWHPRARQAIQDYTRGRAVDFSEIACNLSGMTPFQQHVLRTVREIPRGEVLTYGEVARRVNRPAAARAVGATMARNPVPLIIPCHRVIGASGHLVGFSAPRGIVLKQHLLDMEQSHRAELGMLAR